MFNKILKAIILSVLYILICGSALFSLFYAYTAVSRFYRDKKEAVELSDWIQTDARVTICTSNTKSRSYIDRRGRTQRVYTTTYSCTLKYYMDEKEYSVYTTIYHYTHQGDIIPILVNPDNYNDVKTEWLFVEDYTLPVLLKYLSLPLFVGGSLITMFVRMLNKCKKIKV